MPQYRLTLYHKVGPPYSSALPELSQLLELLKVRYGIDYRLVSEDRLTAESEHTLMMLLRDLIPQRRGEIVTSRGDMLPISKGKNLNLDNTPILLVEKDELLTDV